ncbi:MAG: hypothetical protein U0Y10_10260 [Spirosomataceae bacterium]
MKKIRVPVLGVTLFLLIYTLGSNVGYFSPMIIASMFTISPFVVIWMVIRILKDGTPSPLTMDDQFYEDYVIGGDKR